MNIKILQIHFNQYEPIDEFNWSIFASKIVERSFKRGDIILKEGETEQYISYILSGMACYNILRAPNNITFAFLFPESWISAYDSFITKQPSSFEIKALSDIRMLSIRFEDLEAIYKESSIGERVGRKIIEGLYVAKINREINLLKHTAEENYRHLLNSWPELVQQIPIKYIASYIGIAPQSLSRIRRKISNKC